MAGMNLLNSLAYMLSQQQRSGSGGGAQTRQPQKINFYCASCPDQECQAKLYFPSYEASVECPSCGQRHTVKDLPDKILLADKEDSFGIELAQLRELYSAAKKPPELVKVKGISNYQCKLLSPLLTVYGMDRSDPPQPKLLKDLGLGEVFDCSKFANRVFAIDETQLKVTGYGLDRSGSQRYLAEILVQIKHANSDITSLVPLHADGDGHCLVHAISRCLVGRELFWHALRTNLHQHLTSNHNRYKAMFKDFVSEEEWEGIIEEAGPDFSPPDGQSLGLSNIHVYGLANVLRRPILLLDSWSGMQSSGDYSGVFLPTMHSPTECSTKDSSSGRLKLNSPIVIAWSSSGHNHFIPLVPIKGKPLPKLPQSLFPKVWGPVDDTTLLPQYVSIDRDGCIELCGGRELGDKYLQKLVGCMETVFREKNNVVTSLVADVNQYVYKNAGYASLSLDVVTESTRCAVEENRLFKCLICRSLSCIPPDWLKKGGNLYEKAAETFTLQDGIALSFPYDGVSAKYEAASDSLVLLEVKCFFCGQDTRSLNGDGSIVYHNGDRTSTRAVGSRCRCGFKHFWDGKEYDNLPEKVPLTLTWKNVSKEINIHWFQHESDPSRNSNVYEIAQKVVNDNFPGEFGSERLVQQVVDQILASTELRENIQQVKGQHPATELPPQGMEGMATGSGGGAGGSPNKPQESEEEYSLPSSKMIATGRKSKSLHKEELTMSETERKIKRNVEEHARLQQKKRTVQQQQSHSQSSTRAGTQRRENKGSRVPPSPTSKSSSETSSSPTHKSPTRSSGGKPASKKIKLTLSDGRSANLTLDPNTTFDQLQLAIEKEFSVPPVNQRLRAGFPPKELKPGADPNVPVQLANGERVQVDVINVEPKEDPATLAAAEAQKAIQYLEQVLQGEMDLWSVAQHQPQFFSKGGSYYQQVFDQFGGQVKHNVHIQFKEFHEKVFAFNSDKDRLEVCLGLQHVPVGPLTAEQEALAKIAFQQSSQQHSHSSSSSEGHASMGMSGAIQKHTSSSHIKAFSGKGHTLSSSGTSSSGHTPFSSIGHTLFGSSVGHTLSSNSSSFGMASESGALRAGPSGPGRGGAAGGTSLGGRGRGRFIANSSSVGGDGVSGGSRLAQRTVAVEREDQVQTDNLAADDDPMMAQVQLVAQKKLTLLRERERELKQQVRSINRKLVEAEANEDGAAVRDDRLTSLETKLLDMGSELKKVREEIEELTTLQ